VDCQATPSDLDSPFAIPRRQALNRRGQIVSIVKGIAVVRLCGAIESTNASKRFSIHADAD
jgi:hypothetical protein